MIEFMRTRSETIAIIGFVALFIVFASMIPQVWIANLPSLLRDISWLGIVTIGAVVVIISGEFDLSVGSVAAFIATLFGIMLQAGFDPLLAFALGILASLAIGLLNGLTVWALGLPSLLVTLGFLFVYRGLVYFLDGGFAVAIPPAAQGVVISTLGGQVGSIANAVLFLLLVMVVATFFLGRTKFGNHLFAVGGDARAAAACGIRVGKMKIAAFMISAGLAGFTGMMIASALSSVASTMSEGLEFEAVAAAVIGGCSLRGGAGSAWGAVLGVATLMSLKAGLILLGTNIFAYQILLGLVLVGLISIQGIFPRAFGQAA